MTGAPWLGKPHTRPGRRRERMRRQLRSAASPEQKLTIAWEWFRIEAKSLSQFDRQMVNDGRSHMADYLASMADQMAERLTEFTGKR